MTACSKGIEAGVRILEASNPKNLTASTQRTKTHMELKSFHFKRNLASPKGEKKQLKTANEVLSFDHHIAKALMPGDAKLMEQPRIRLQGVGHIDDKAPNLRHAMEGRGPLRRIQKQNALPWEGHVVGSQPHQSFHLVQHEGRMPLQQFLSFISPSSSTDQIQAGTGAGIRNGFPQGKAYCLWFPPFSPWFPPFFPKLFTKNNQI